MGLVYILGEHPLLLPRGSDDQGTMISLRGMIATGPRIVIYMVPPLLQMTKNRWTCGGFQLLRALNTARERSGFPDTA